MIVLVCGGRDFANYGVIRKYLDMLHAIYHFDLLIHGDNKGHEGHAGADKLTHQWAVANNIDVRRFAANWDQYSRAAGPIRNRLMIVVGKPNLVIAFPGGRGTRNMVMQAGDHGIRVINLAHENERASVEADFADMRQWQTHRSA